MEKLDAHQHFWDMQRCEYPWLGPELGPIFRNFVPDDLAPTLAESGVSGTIAVQATHSQVETEWYLELAQNYPFIKGVVGWLDLTAYDFEEKLDTLATKGPLCGLRHQVHDEPQVEWLLQPKVLRGLRLLAAKDYTFDLLVRPPHLPMLPALFEAVPNGRWVIDHLAKPLIKSGELEPWLTDMRRVAYHPNVYCKVSGMITEADHQNWTVDNIRPYFEAVLQMFGPKRLLYGSDWPVCLLAGRYQQVHDLVASLIAALSSDEQAAIWAGTARQAYRGLRTADCGIYD